MQETKPSSSLGNNWKLLACLLMISISACKTGRSEAINSMPCPLLVEYTAEEQQQILTAKYSGVLMMDRLVDDYGRLRATIKANCE